MRGSGDRNNVICMDSVILFFEWQSVFNFECHTTSGGHPHDCRQKSALESISLSDSCWPKHKTNKKEQLEHSLTDILI